MKNLVLIFSCFFVSNLFAQGFYYNPVNKQFFSNKMATFSIRPVQNVKYLEKIEISIDGSEFKPYSGKLKFDTESVHYVRFRAVDPVLNWSPIQTFKIYVDNTPPVSRAFWTGTTFVADKKFYVSKTSQLNVSAEDNLSGASKIEYRKDKSSKGTAFTVPLNFDKDGEYVLELSSIDNVDNIEPWKEVAFTVDTKAPVSSIDVKGLSKLNGNRLYVGSSSRIFLNANDSGCGVKKIEYRINEGAIAEYKQPVSISSNMFKMFYRSIDNVDNAEEWRQMEVYLDSQPPEITIKEAGENSLVSSKLYVKAGFKLLVTATDKDSGVKEIQVFKNGKIIPTPEKMEFEFKEAGENTFFVKVLDYVNNISESNPYTIVVDAIAPISELKTTEALVERDGVFLSALPNRIDIKASDNGVGVERIEVSFDGKAYEPFLKNIDLASWKDAQNTIYYRAIDRLGNVEKPKSITIKVLTNSPVVDLFVESEGLPDVALSKIIEKGKIDVPSKIEGNK